MQISLTTTGNSATVTINDLGAISFDHPVVDFPLVSPEGPYDFDVVNESLENGDLGASLAAGDINVQVDSTDTGFGIYAWADVTGTTGALNEGLGLSVVRNGVGSYTYSFDAPVSTANYAVNVQLYGLAVNTDTNPFVDNRTVNGFDLTIGQGDNGTTLDVLMDEDHTVAILGPNNGVSSSNAPSIIRVEDNGGSDLSINYNINGTAIATILSTVTFEVGNATTDFTNAAGSITCNFNGLIEVIGNVPHTSTGTRAALKTTVQINGADYGAPDHSYIRNGSGVNKDKNTVIEYVQVTNGQVIRLGERRSELSSNGNDIFILPGTNMTIKRLQ